VSIDLRKQRWLTEPYSHLPQTWSPTTHGIAVIVVAAYFIRAAQNSKSNANVVIFVAVGLLIGCIFAVAVPCSIL
jgi:hypothetical protein